MTDNPDYYAIFLGGVLGLIDDAETSGWDEDGLAHLREAYEFFASDHRIRKQAQDEAAQREAALRRGLKE